MAIMLELNHPNIIKLLDFFEKKDHYYMVVEKVQGERPFIPTEVDAMVWHDQTETNTFILQCSVRDVAGGFRAV